MSTQDNCQFRLERINMPEVILLDKPDHTYTCGRAKDNQIVCLSLTVSRRHCIFFHSKDELYVTDLKSANGLFINGVAQEPFRTTKLHPNDVIGVGCPDVDVKDKNMFAYILRLIAQPQKVPSYDATTTLSETILNETNVSTRCATSDESDSAIKRKRLGNSCDAQVVPNKVPKLDNDIESCSEKKPAEIIEVSEHSDAMDENDLEVIHVSLNNSILEQNRNNCDSSTKSIKLNNQLNLSKHTDCDILITSCNVDDQKCSESSTNCEAKPDELINSMNLESLVLSDMNNSIKDKENSVSSCKSTFQNVQKSTENNLSNNKNKENLFSNTSKCNNKQSENRVEDASTKLNSKRDGKTTNNAMSSRLPPNFIHSGDTVIKMEEELQLTDTDEDAIWNSTNDVRLPIVSPIKLKQVQQQPKTKFSEEDVVNLSDTEDDIFPCSQLFDIGFGMNTSIKQEVKKEVKEEEVEVEHEGFSMLDDEDLVISLSDSDDEDKNWLRRLSRSQILNEDDIKTETREDCVKKEDLDIEMVDVQKSVDTLEKFVDILPLTKNDERAKANKDMQPEEEKKSSTHDEDEENRSTNSLSTSLERLEVDSVDRATNSLESFNKNTISYKKSSELVKHKTLDLNRHETESSMTSIAEPVKTFRKKSLEKKVPQIEPLHLPTGRRSTSANRVPEKPLKEKLSSKEKKELKEKAKLEEYMRAKDQKNRRVLNKWADCLPSSKKKISPLTKEEKKQLADDRKQKLKKIAMEEKRLSLENNQEKKRIAPKPKAKVSLKTRSDFLMEATTSATKLEEIKEKPKIVNRSTMANNVQTSPKTPKSTKNIETVKEIPSRNILGKIPKKSNAAKTKTNALTQDTLEEVMLSQRVKIIENSVRDTQAKNKSKTDSTISSPSVSILNFPGKRTKKRVSFSSVIKTVREYEIDESNVLKKLTGKDAPLPIRPMKEVTENEITNEFLLRIFLWSPVWLEEQQRLNSTAPVVRDDELHVMLTHYKSYEEYYRVISPLLLLETWYGITKEFQTIDKNCRRPTLMCSIVENSIETNTPSPNVHFTTLMLEVLVTREDLQKQAHPTYGDLVFFEYTRNQQKGQTFHKVFAYVNNVHNTTLSDWTHYNKELANYVHKPYALITYTVLTRRLESNILVNRVRRLRSVTYLRPNLRMVQALEYLPKSPVMNLILSPKIEQYHLPNVPIQSEQLITRDKLNPKQLEAVFKVTETIVQKQAKLCFIQGPPGTGKSKVIVNIVSQVLYGNNRYVSNESPLKILVCAPSNAAIDEITLRLLQIRSSMKQKRFKMVRIGRSEVMHPVVKDISVVELAKRDMKKTQTNSMNIPLDSVEEEKTLLESKINKLKCEIACTQNMDKAYKEHLKMRLADMNVKYELLKNRRPLNEMNSKEFARIQRSAENRILSHADIITCTLSSCYSKQMESLFVTNKKGISVCIVDEATQSIETETLIPLMLGVNTLVLVGDPNQLPATVLSPRAKIMGLDQSIFSRVQNAFEMNPINPIIMLDTQYRMPHDICSWPNKFFYAGKLKTAILRDEEFPFHSYRIFHVNTNQNNDNFSNSNEAQFIANMIHSMLTHANLDGYDFISCGILTPYNNQKHVILKKINDKMLSLSENLRKKIRFEVNTVDGFQGQERDVIIMSCVRSQRIGFLSDRQRLCVALTRAKHSLIICGNFSVFNKDPMWNSLLSDARSRKIYFNVNAQADPQEIKQHVVKRFSC